MKLITLAIAGLVLTACSGTAEEPTSTETVADVQSRIEAISEQVSLWRSAEDLAAATSAAEAAANLVVGPNGPGYGDRNNDGMISGASDAGLLPGEDGTPPGLVLTALGNAACIERDVLGGSWDDPEARWQELVDAVNTWTPNNNTMPSLASHPMRIVGWATFTQTANLDEAHEYGGHAAIHVNVSDQALNDC